MVVNPRKNIIEIKEVFESSVISYGSESPKWRFLLWIMFESSVISYGSESKQLISGIWCTFESSVISYGSESKKGGV